MELPYRKCVVAVIQNSQGLYLAGERAKKNDTWQFPQGGVEIGEDSRTGLLRELAEKIGCNRVDILREAPEEVFYDFPVELDAKIAKNFRGQVQRWFLLQFKPGAEPNLAKSDGEFQNLMWKPLEEIVLGIVYWKREAYLKGINLLGLPFKG